MAEGNWIKIERQLTAPIGEVWRMWTDPAHFVRWYGPGGMAVSVIEMDPTINGARRIRMKRPGPGGGMSMFFTGAFTEIDAPGRLVYTEAMCDAEGAILSPEAMGMPEGTPEVTEVSVDLAPLSGGTRIVLVHRGVPAGSPGEAGWRNALDALAGLLD
ncbi:SRPBCC family protein [Poseidonocella sedimentorum]|uniref:Uncharacterized conserved protein YndB, AHSA1/START domain n=1 Tax=Poseidonocella sedimentorum TaxID=871652 RepID=A0A1I6D8U4_9RHOB|nr:SRPBCC domain-containing protein [Poseidonocella sedimentorum]SFR01752.1 Uncharacterized conserved protein YndB, AHSA1/START domain [Poseidonocella sedimentorum]